MGIVEDPQDPQLQMHVLISTFCMLHKIDGPMAERVGCVTPCLLGSLGVREVVGSCPGGGIVKNFSSYQATGKVFSPEMPFYSKF